MARYREKAKRIVDAQELTFQCNFTDGSGGIVVAEVGDFLVTEADGSQCIMDCEEFNSTFEAIKQKGPKKANGAETDCDDDLEATDTPRKPGRPRKDNSVSVPELVTA